MNYTYTCLNPIAAIGLNNLTDAYTRTEDFAAADAVFVRSAKMAEDSTVAEPSFEPGETTLDMRVVGKVKFK